jgi:hypothetical protein
MQRFDARGMERSLFEQDLEGMQPIMIDATGKPRDVSVPGDGAAMPADLVKEARSGAVTRESFIGDDGPIMRRYGFVPGGNEKKTRWLEYMDWKKKHPLVKWGNLGQIYKWPLYMIAGGLFKMMEIKEENRTNIFLDVLGGVIDAEQVKYGHMAQNLIFTEIFPGLRTELDFAEGPVRDLGRVYTIEYTHGINKRHCPIYLQKKSQLGTDPTSVQLADRIKYVVDNKESPYNESTKLVVGGDEPPIVTNFKDHPIRTLYRESFSDLAAIKYTRLAFGGSDARYTREDELFQMAFPTWMVRNQIRLFRQLGDNDTAREASYGSGITVDGVTYKIHVFKPPEYLTIGGAPARNPTSGNPISLKNWWAWKKGDWTYDLISTALDPMLAGFEKLGLSERGLARIVLNFYKGAIAPAERGLTNPRSPDLTFDYKNL